MLLWLTLEPQKTGLLWWVCRLSGADGGGVDGVASHPPFTCSFAHDTME